MKGRSRPPHGTSSTAAGFEVLALEEQTTDSSRVGFVLSQTPSGGASIPGANIPRGSLVILYVGA